MRGREVAKLGLPGDSKVGTLAEGKGPPKILLIEDRACPTGALDGRFKVTLVGRDMPRVLLVKGRAKDPLSNGTDGTMLVARSEAPDARLVSPEGKFWAKLPESSDPPTETIEETSVTPVVGRERPETTPLIGKLVGRELTGARPLAVKLDKTLARVVGNPPRFAIVGDSGRPELIPATPEEMLGIIPAGLAVDGTAMLTPPLVIGKDRPGLAMVGVATI